MYCGTTVRPLALSLLVVVMGCGGEPLREDETLAGTYESSDPKSPWVYSIGGDGSLTMRASRLTGHLTGGNYYEGRWERDADTLTIRLETIVSPDGSRRPASQGPHNAQVMTIRDRKLASPRFVYERVGPPD